MNLKKFDFSYEKKNKSKSHKFFQSQKYIFTLSESEIDDSDKGDNGEIGRCNISLRPLRRSL